MGRFVPALLTAWLASAAVAEVRINEVMMASTEWVVHRLPDGTPRIGAGAGWFENSFDASEWTVASGPFGFGYGGVAENLQEQMVSVTPSLYARTSFTLDPDVAESTASVQLEMAWVDGVVVYLNGREVLRRNLGGRHMPMYANMPAFHVHETTTPEVFPIGKAGDWLVPGRNVLAVQVHNDDVTDERLFFKARCWIDDTPARELIPANKLWRVYTGSVEPSGGLLSDRPEAGPLSDWIELYNPEPAPVDLEGWGLTDAPEHPHKWRFPPVSIPGQGYLLVRCTSLDLRDPALPLHANFKLKGEGERIQLMRPDGILASDLDPSFRSRGTFHSYGWDGQAYRYFEQITPGRSNEGPAYEGILKKPAFRLPPGFYPGPLSVEITSGTNTVVRYTLDGAEPDESSPLVDGPLEILASTAIRARSFQSGWIPSGVETRTYLIDEPAPRQGVPAVCITADTGQSLYHPNGVTAIEGGEYIPALPGQIGQWTSTSNSDYNLALLRGHGIERPASFEIFDPGALAGWAQEDIGIRLSGPDHARPFYLYQDMSGIWNGPNYVNKPAFNLYFRDDYGASRLAYDWLAQRPEGWQMETLRMRSGKNDWKTPFIIDEMVRRTFHACGHPSALGILSTLFINGEFKGYYNPCERLTENFFQRTHGRMNDWDILNQAGVESGDSLEYLRLRTSILDQDLSVLSNYKAVQEQLDLDNYVDYILLNTYAGNEDWPQNNFTLARERIPGSLWIHSVWDAEFGLGLVAEVSEDQFVHRLLRGTHDNQKIFRALLASPDFRLRFADRIRLHMFDGGALTEDRLRALHDALAIEAAPLIQHVHGLGIRAIILPWVEQRAAHFLSHARTHGLWPVLSPPRFGPSGGPPSLDGLVLSNPDGVGTIYYTLDGSDPREPGGAVSSAAHEVDGPVQLAAPWNLVARVKNADDWSAATRARFAPPNALRITEIMYHPADAPGFENEALEYLELKNAGPHVMDLSGVSFSDGIEFRFPPGSMIAPGETWVLVGDEVGFSTRYPNTPWYGVFDGNLSNAGERIALVDAAGGDLLEVVYDDDPPWPQEADGGGYSLYLRFPGGDGPFSDARHWIVSGAIGGSPGTAPSNLPPIPLFSISQSERAVRFDASGTMDPDGTITQFQWDLGDGSTASGIIVTHVFSKVDTWEVALTVWDNLGETVRQIQSIQLEPIPPIAVTSWTTTEGAACFDASGSSDPVGSIVSYAWHFGDGSTGSGIRTCHDYAHRGTYEAVLTVTDDVGAIGTSTQSIEISIEPPVAAFQWWSQGLRVAATALGTYDAGGAITKYDWSFGDGATATGPTVAHTYPAPGVYPVQLTVTDELGWTDAIGTNLILQIPETPIRGDNAPHDRANLALAEHASLSDAGIPPESRLGSPGDLVYNLYTGRYEHPTEANEFGVTPGVDVGLVAESNAVTWQCDWATAKSFNYVSVGGSRSQGRQATTAWKVEMLHDEAWHVLDAGVGGWVDGGIFQWGGHTQTPVTARALRVKLYSGGTDPLVGPHLRAHGGLSSGADDRAETRKGLAILWLDGDGDNDGILDHWEGRHGLDVTVDDSSGDPDDDGLSNLDEFLADTSPRDPQAFPRLTLRSDKSGMVLEFPSSAERDYSLQMNSDPAHGAWITRLTGIPGTGRPILLLASPVPRQQFYRMISHPRSP